MKNILKKIELHKFNKLVNKNTTVLFTNGNEIEYVYDKKNNKRYYPKNSIIIER